MKVRVESPAGVLAAIVTGTITDAVELAASVTAAPADVAPCGRPAGVTCT